MAQSLNAMDHKNLVAHLKKWNKVPDTENPEYYYSKYDFQFTKEEWTRVGDAANEVADQMTQALQRLMDSDNGWKGEAATSFRQKADQIIYFARQIAHMSDGKKYIKPTPPPPPDDGNPFPTGGTVNSSAKSFTENLRTVLDELEAMENDPHGKLPPMPWYKEDGQWKGWWTKAYSKGGIGVDMFEIRCGDEVFKGGITNDEIQGKFGEWHVRTREAGGGPLGSNYTVPADWKEDIKVFYGYRMNSGQEEICKATAQKYATALQDAGAALPDAPQAPQLSLKPTGDLPGGPGGPGGPGSGPGGPGSPTVPDNPFPSDPPPPPPDPDLPDEDDLPDPDDPDDTDLPDPDDPDDPELPDPDDPDDPQLPDPDDPDDPQLPDPNDPGDDGSDQDSDGDGIPDWKDTDDDGDGVPDWKDTDDDGDGVPDWKDTGSGGGGYGGGGGGGVDTGTETARAGSGSLPLPGEVPNAAMSGGPTGPSGLVGTGASGAGVGVGAGGVPGAGAGLGAGAGAGRGLTGTGGMMPPMMGGGGGGGAGQEQEQERNTWLEEDENVWTGDDDDAPPPVIGGSV
ncbi:hypothetical protein [Tenggerimyces flavus]|uniref:WXG100 family type VII secretion target n=1 Tax=Tenggerimyces flavus TaxID=1708749 RepID=A0ABV7YM80_9ACTN|nr:hypothetical protein [Tenggerimyces flavus]MBM7787773.1 uncharacterized protein YukE [Tenggerimyces flavus]